MNADYHPNYGDPVDLWRQAYSKRCSSQKFIAATIVLSGVAVGGIGHLPGLVCGIGFAIAPLTLAAGIIDRSRASGYQRQGNQMLWLAERPLALRR